jgi:hypothetical protein
MTPSVRLVRVGLPVHRRTEFKRLHPVPAFRMPERMALISSVAHELKVFIIGD